MDTASLKRFAQEARRQLLDQVSARLEHVLRVDTGELREKKQTLQELQEQIDQSSKQAVIDRVAYTWFNRFCALRFMDVNHYTRVGIVSPAEGRTQPEILQDAKQGLVADWLKVDRQRVLDLLTGKATSANPQQEAYRLLVVGACNAYHVQMPFLFEAIDDYSELLMPEDLLSENSVVQAVRDTLTPEACQDVEVIGWLYQYYISERKDEVFANLKKNKKIQPEDIPAATQLFTPHWIVRYLVENSLGRLWMLNHPESKLVEQMEYYIQPEQEETDFPKIDSPEEIRVCDPACGSGHMLTYAFDLFNAIYEEQGYDPLEIPSWILTNNLYGVEIDERAGHLAAFALMMKARKRDQRFFSRGVEPNICVLENMAFTEEELDTYMDTVGRDLFTQDLQETLTQFEQADNFGSLIQPKVKETAFIRQRIEDQGVFEDLFLHHTNQKVIKVLEQAEYLSPGYHAVVANPPYMGGRGLNRNLRDFAKSKFPASKSDLYSMFMERTMDLANTEGFVGLMTPFTWMHLTSYSELRISMLKKFNITSLVKPEYHAFFESAFVPICAFTLSGGVIEGFKGTYIDLSEFSGPHLQPEKTLEAIRNPDCGWSFNSSARDFRQIPGSPIAYAVSGSMKRLFSEGEMLGQIADVKKGADTGNNMRFLRLWHEIPLESIGGREAKWVFYNKGGKFRRWYGNYEYVVNYDDDGRELKGSSANLRSEHLYFRESLTWSAVTSSKFSVRYSDKRTIFDSAGSSLFSEDDLFGLLGYLNTHIVQEILDILNPTMNYGAGDVAKVPRIGHVDCSRSVERLIELARNDWNSHETSYDFEDFWLLRSSASSPLFAGAFNALRTEWEEATLSMKRLEQKNREAFADAYGFGEDLDPTVLINEISLSCNPHYRYPDSSSKTYTEEEREAMLLEDTMKEFISYSVGCMFGRYSLDRPGLILADQGETAEDYRRQVTDPTFPVDEDNVIPILDEGWFTDDIAERFKQFLQETFASENYEKNLAFLEDAIGKDIRSYFLKSFYNEHVKMYKKRPIYWLFSSPNGSFNALIYMHRYRPDTISIILNDYLRQYHEKLHAHRERLEQVSISGSASRGEKTKALREVDKVSKVLTELKVYEDEILYPLATRQVEIDLDDGVKVNYNKFGKALKHVSGLSE